MSTDPSAILYYGIKFGDEWPGEDYSNISEEWEKDLRPPQPTNKNYHSPEWDQWRDKYSEWKKTPQYVEADWSGSEHGYCYYVHAHALKLEVEWDDQVEVPPLAASPEHDEWIRKFCERFGLPYSQPKWHLASRYF